MEVVKVQPKQIAGRGVTRDLQSLGHPGTDALNSVREWADDVQEEEELIEKNRLKYQKDWEKEERKALWVWWSVISVLGVFFIIPILFVAVCGGIAFLLYKIGQAISVACEFLVSWFRSIKNYFLRKRGS